MSTEAVSPDPLVGESAWAAYGALVTLGYVIATAAGVGGRPLTMAVGAGGAALAAASSPALNPASFVALVGVPLAVAACLGGGRGRELSAVIALLAVASWRHHRRLAIVGGAGAGLLFAGVLVGRSNGAEIAFAVDPGNSAVAAGLLAAAALLLLVAAVGSEQRNALAVLLVPAVIAGLAASAGAASAPRFAVAAGGIVAVVAAVANRPAGALAALSVAASTAIDEPSVAILLAASAVLVAAWAARQIPPSVVVAVPALAGLAGAVVSDPTVSAVGLGGFGTLCVVAIITRVDASRWRHWPIEPAMWPAAGLAVWLILAPQTWGWVGPTSPAVATSAQGIAMGIAVVCFVLAASAVVAAGRSRRLHR